MHLALFPASDESKAQTKATATEDESSQLSESTSAPFVMPAYHGDTAIAYYDLPAANMMPHIIPNSTTPIPTQLIRPLQFKAGPADTHLAEAVAHFLVDVEGMFMPSAIDDDETPRDWEINEMGERSRRNVVHTAEGYYGWSRPFCEKMKDRTRGGPKHFDSDGGRGRLDADDLHIRSGRSSRKRSRYSDSDSSRTRSPSRGHGYNHGRPGSRSPPYKDVNRKSIKPHHGGQC